MEHLNAFGSTSGSAAAAAGSTCPLEVVSGHARIVELRIRREGTSQVPTEGEAVGFDDVRQLAVVVWARIKLLERTLSDQVAIDSKILTGLAEIEDAAVAIGERLDSLEDAQAKWVA